jgi:undecaprenyl-diphosphatase
MLRGLDRAAAARFAFLLSMPVMLAAGAYELLGLLRHPPSGAFLPALGIGMLTAALSGWLAIRWLLRYLQTRSLWPFVLYCAVGGSLTLALSMLR